MNQRLSMTSITDTDESLSLSLSLSPTLQQDISRVVLLYWLENSLLDLSSKFI